MSKNKRFEAKLTHGDSILIEFSPKQQVVDLVKLADLLNGAYVIPGWCRMHPMNHFDGMGGCWSISHGLVPATGGECCQDCEFNANNIKEDL